MNKKFSELSTEEMEKVWNNNEALRREVENNYYEVEMEHIIDLLNPIKNGLSKYDVGFYNRNEIVINEDRISELHNGIEKSQSSYELFSEENYKTIQECFKNEEYNRVENMLFDVFDDWTSPHGLNDLYNYYNEFYSITFIDETYFVDEDYNLYQTEIKSFN